MERSSQLGALTALLLVVGCEPPPDVSTFALSPHVELPASADGPMRITDGRTGTWLAARLSGAAGAPGTRAGDEVVYRGAAPGGGDVLFRARAAGVEDWITFHEAPERALVTYEISVGPAVAGLRLVERMLEVLDAGGAPRLRVSPPWLIGADGQRHEAELTVKGCAVDRSPAPPWGRAVVAPGSDECRLIVSWDAGAVRYPATLDPLWTLTQTMGAPRVDHGACLLGDGRVLVAGGSTIGAELFDPATETWAVTGSPAVDPDRSELVLVSLDDGRALMAGGATGFVTANSTLYDPATGQWTAAPDMSTPRRWATGSRLADGTVLVTGGQPSSFDPPDASAERFDPVLGTWSPAGAMSSGRIHHTLSVLPDGRALAAGGFTTSGLATADLYDPASNTWSPASPMSVARGYHTASTLPDGRLLVAGGYDGLDLDDVEIFDPVAGTWGTGPALPVPRSGHMAASLPDGRALLVGGCINVVNDCLIVSEAFTFEPAASTWLQTPPMNHPRIFHTETTLADGRVLVAGGQSDFGLDSAELFALASDGGSCTADGECLSGHCADGVCCDAACLGPCVACTAVKTGGADGVCGPIPVGEDPDSDCFDSGSPACAETGVCDGAGACEMYPTQAGCMPQPCAAGADCASGFCDPDDSICCDASCTGECMACTAAKKGGGEDGICGAIEGKTDPDGECSADPTEDDCAKITLCNGEGACESASSLCVPYACADGACRLECESDPECAPGFSCSDGECVASDTSCKDEATAVDGSGTEFPCAPYRCEAGNCLDSCNSVDDCLAPAVCDASGACVAPPPPPPGDEGCSCKTAPRRDAPGSAGVLLALCALVSRLRAGRPRRAPPPRRSRG